MSRPRRDVFDKKVVALYNQGLIASKIANMLDCCKDTIYNVLKHFGISRRPRQLALRRYSLDLTFFKSINTESKAYWLGFVTADGGIVNSRLTVNLARRDRVHLEKLRQSLKTDQPIKDRDSFRKGKNSPASYLAISSKPLVDDLAFYGVVPRKSTREKYYQCSGDLSRHYLRGLFDGDGCLGKTKFGYRLTFCGSKEMVNAFAEHLIGKLNVVKQKMRKQKKLWYVYFGRKSDINKILNYLYADATLYLNRKHSQYNRFVRENV